MKIIRKIALRVCRKLLSMDENAKRRSTVNLALRKVHSILSEGKPVLLDIGAERKRLLQPHIITLDQNEACDINWNLGWGLPFPDNSVDTIYCSHVLEHFPRRHGDALLIACYRALKPGGNILLAVPNARLYIEAYTSGQVIDYNLLYKPALRFSTGIDYINYMAYMDGHHFHMFDCENLLACLHLAGFENASAREFDCCWDLEERRWESIYVIAVKPPRIAVTAATLGQ